MPPAVNSTTGSLPAEATSATSSYGAWGEKTVGDARVVGSLRSTFVLDEAGRVEHALYEVPARGHVRALRELLGLDAPSGS